MTDNTAQTYHWCSSCHRRKPSDEVHFMPELNLRLCLRCVDQFRKLEPGFTTSTITDEPGRTLDGQADRY